MVYSQDEIYSPSSKERAMTQASYNDIAQWYDQFLRERPVYAEVLLPNLLALVGEVKGEVICDLACGQGWVARELARGDEEQEPLGIVYVQGDAQRAEQLRDSQFTGCICVMALINIPDLQATFQSVRRILKPGGWLVFAIPHPISVKLSQTPKRSVRGGRYSNECSGGDWHSRPTHSSRPPHPP